MNACDVRSMFDLTGQVALVTGCRRGLGLAMAEVLAAAGAEIVGASAQLEAEDSEVERRVRALGQSFRGYRVDFSERQQVLQFAAEVLQNSQPIDILVNNAGVIVRSPAVDHGDDIWDEVMNINVTAPYVLTREIGREMVQRGRGKVIFTASLLSFQGGILVPSYAASKSAIAGLIRAFSNEWARYGVNVNGIAPGYMVTDNTNALRADEVRRGAVLDRIPAGRWGLAADVAGATLYLAARASDYVCGAIVPVDGGWLAR